MKKTIKSGLSAPVAVLLAALLAVTGCSRKEVSQAVFEKLYQEDSETYENDGDDITADGIFEGVWMDVPDTMLGMQIFLSDSLEVSANRLSFSGNKFTVGKLEGVLGLGSSVTTSGTFRVNTKSSTLILIDEFGDQGAYRYVFSENSDGFVLKLKDSDGEVTTWYQGVSKSTESSFTDATHRATANLRLRESPAADANIVTTITQNSEVQLLERGETVTIDDKSAPWVKVKTSDGAVGWCFSGYLAEI